ncbi:MAG: MCE family protein [Deltaproteobacteria bacterium]|nr:MCE family protein [Deltaproteobacteria bacterium]
MKKLDAELLVGFVLLLGIGVLVFLSLRLGQVDLTGGWGYTVQADFPTAGGLQTGAVVELAGVKIGRVEGVELANYHARVKLKIQSGVSLHEDARAAIKTKGLIGERYVEITPGRAAGQIAPGGQIRDTEPPVDIQEIITKFIFGNVEQKTSDEDAPHKAGTRADDTVE